MARLMACGWENGEPLHQGSSSGLSFQSADGAGSGSGRAWNGLTWLSHSPGQRAAWFQFRVKLEDLPTGGNGKRLLYECRNGSTNPSGNIAILYTSGGALEFYIYGGSPGTDAVLLVTQSGLVVNQWYLVEFKVEMNTATQTGTPGTETNARVTIWFDGAQIVDYNPGGSLTNAIGPHITGGSFVSLVIGDTTQSSLATATTGRVVVDDFIMDTSARTNGQRIIGLRQTGPGSVANWTNQDWVSYVGPHNAGGTFSTTALQQQAFVFEDPADRGVTGSSQGDVYAMFNSCSAFVVGMTATLVINGVAGTPVAFTATSATTQASQGRLVTFTGVTINPGDTIELIVTKDNSATQRFFGSVVIGIVVNDADYTQIEPETNVEFDQISYTGDGATYKTVSLPFVPDFVLVVPTGGTTQRLPVTWDSHTRTSRIWTESVHTAIFNLTIPAGSTQMRVSSNTASNPLNQNGENYDVFVIRDPSRRVLKLSDFTNTATGDNNTHTFDDVLATTCDFASVGNHSTSSTGSHVWRGPNAAGDLSYRIGQTLGGEADYIQALGDRTYQVGAASAIIESIYNCFYGFVLGRFNEETLVDVVSWTGNGSNPRVISLPTMTATPGMVMVIPVGGGTSVNGRRGHIRTTSFTSTNSRHMSSSGGVVTTGITALGAGSFTVSSDANLSAQTYTALVFAEGFDPGLPPEIIPSGAVFVWTEEGADVDVDPDIEIDYIGNLSSGVVIIDENAQPGDELVYATTHGVTGSYNAVTFTLTLSGTATAAQWQDVLRAIKFRCSVSPVSQVRRRVSLMVSS